MKVVDHPGACAIRLASDAGQASALTISWRTPVVVRGYQDFGRAAYLYHSRLSAAMNLKLVNPVK